MRGTLLTLTGAAAFCVATTSFGAVVTLQDYETASAADINTNNQAFMWRPTLSGSTSGLDAGSVELAADGVFGSAQSAKVIVDTTDAETPMIRFLGNSGGSSASPNQVLGDTGYVGYYYKLSADYAAAGVKVGVTMDAPGTGDTSVTVDAVADGAWHLVQWDLADDSQFGPFIFGGGLGDGVINGPVSIDSLFLTAADGADFEIQIDSISWDADGMLADVPEPATIALLGLGGLAMLRRRK